MSRILPGMESYTDELRSIQIDRMCERIQEIFEDVSTGPWKHDTENNFGKNWLLATFGEGHDGDKWLLTTDHVPCSEFSGDAKADAEFCAIARALLPLLIEERKRQ